MVELLDKNHNRKDFDCGISLLNDYLKTQAGQDVKRKLSACFVLPEIDSRKVIAYYTLSSYSIPLNHFSDAIQKKLPKSYQSIPTTLLGRLAVDKSCHGRGLGKIMLIDALKRSYENVQSIGSFAVVVEPVNKEAEAFYKKYDFIPLPESGKMFIATATLQELFS